jgi:hypothetical protein
MEMRGTKAKIVDLLDIDKVRYEGVGEQTRKRGSIKICGKKV